MRLLKEMFEEFWDVFAGARFIIYGMTVGMAIGHHINSFQEVGIVYVSISTIMAIVVYFLIIGIDTYLVNKIRVAGENKNGKTI